MPRYGFNFLWMFALDPEKRPHPEPPDLPALDLLADCGLDFVRIPLDYRFWTTGFDYAHREEGVLAHIDDYLAATRARGLHLCLNLHRAPGYCINRRELERDNLWTDAVAQDAFVAQWAWFARRYRGVPSDALSFDLVNEPPSEEWGWGLTRANHEALVRRTVAAIRAIDPAREIVIDGLGGGNLPMPELADLDVVQSGRGYRPMHLTHYRAPWCQGTMDLPAPRYPGPDHHGTYWDRDALRACYQPWRDLAAQGVRVHIGEFGCFNQTPHDVALRWFADLLALFREFGWGYALWNFRGPFGIAEHGRPGAVYEAWHDYRVDRALLDLYLAHRVDRADTG